MAPTDPVLREIAQWSIYAPKCKQVRYDFAYVDPASKWQIQIGVDCTIPEDVTPEQAGVLEVAKNTIIRMLKRKCGVKRAVMNQIPLDLPRIVPGRYV